MRRSNRISFWVVALLAGTGAAEETIEYAEADGTERSSPVIGVTKDEEKEFINNLRRALGLPGDDANMIAKVMMWKNQG